MNTKLEFHGSDIEKVCEHYGLKKEDIVNFGANVNPLGLSEQVKKSSCNSSGSALFLPGSELYQS